jgi:Uma2 family endonuclease
MSVAERLTVAEYLEQDNPRHTELLDGVVVVNVPALLHQRICAWLYSALWEWERSSDGSGETTLPLDLILGEDVVAPDLLWFAEPLPADSPRAPRPPELVVEVRSPSTWAHDIGRKHTLYQTHGVRELWLVDTVSESVLRFARSTPESATIDVEEELDRAEVLRSPLLPGFALAVAELFAGAGDRSG